MKLALRYFWFVLLLGCSSTPIIIEHTVPVYVPAIKDSIVLRDSLIYKDSVLVDSVWFGEVQDSIGNSLGDLTVFYKKKIAWLNLHPRVDSVKTIDTVKVPTQGTVLETVSGFLNWWEEGILLLVAMLLLTWKAKRKAII